MFNLESSRAVSAAFAVGVAAFVVAMLIGSCVQAEVAPVAILAASIVAPFVLFAFAQALAWRPGYAHVLCVAIIFFQSAVLRVREIEDKSIDAQILIKLVCIATMLTLAITAFWKRRSLFRPQMADVVVWCSFPLYLLASVLISVNPTTAFVEALSNVAAFLFLLGITLMLGPRALVEILLVACFCLCTASLFAYLLDPQLGRMSDWVDGAFIATSRLQGVFGTANAAGACGAVGLLMTIFFSRISMRSPAFYVLTAPFVACTLLSNNRMSVAAVLLALAFVSMRKGEATLKLAIGVCIVSICAILFANYGDMILEAFSRSGSASEITSGTGRTRIWAVVIDLWMERPLFGYGVGSAKYILPHHPLLFKAAAHAHDLYLSVLFAGGAVGLTVFVVNILSTIRRMSRRRSHEALGLVVFFLFYGITEPTIGGLVSFLSMTFYATIIFSFYSKESLTLTSTGAPWSKWLEASRLAASGLGRSKSFGSAV